MMQCAYNIQTQDRQYTHRVLIVTPNQRLLAYLPKGYNKLPQMQQYVNKTDKNIISFMGKTDDQTLKWSFLKRLQFRVQDSGYCHCRRMASR